MNNLLRVQPPISQIDEAIAPAVSCIQLDNHIPVYLIESGTENIMRIEFTFKAGQVYEYLPLLASATNLMLTEGSQNYSSVELNRLLDYYGSFINLSTEKDCAGLVVYFLNKHIEKILGFCKEILFSPTFPEEEIKTLMKKRQSWFLVNKEKVQNLAMDQFFESVFGSTHPYGRKVAYDDFENLNSALLKDFHEKYYTPENMAIIASGRIDERTAELLNLFFGNLRSENIYIENTENRFKRSRKRKVHISQPGALQTAIRIGSGTINRRDPDYRALKITDSILGGYFGSRLMKNLREEKGFTYGINSYITSFDLSGYKVISTEVSINNTQNAIDEIYKEIDKLQRFPVENAELTVVRNFMLGEMVRLFDGPFAAAESFKSVWELGLDNDYYNKLSEKIRTIQPDEIISLARTYYNINNMYEITAGSK
jgi:predicted Zn-dependent peptidase